MQHRKLLILSIVSSVFVILYEFFKWSIIDIVTEFMIFPIWLIVFGFFVVITLRAVIYLFKNKDWKPITVQVITILILFFFPFTEIVLDIDFKMNKSEREKVTEMVENGTLKSNVSYNSSLILLPERYQYLSKGGGEIEVEKTDKGYYILFFTYRGILDNFSGFVYSSNDQKPSKRTFDGDFKQIEKLKENWYWVGSY